MKFYCVIGYPIKHSLSPKIHNAAFRKLRIAAKYEAVEVAPKDLARFMRSFREKYSGGNVTIPHKVAVMKFLDRISPEARAIGAVNTIVNKNGKLTGYNTDVYGAMSALQDQKSHAYRQAGKIKNQRVIVLGAGGAARAVVYGLKKAGAKITILNRTVSHVEKLAREFGCEWLSLRAQRSNPLVDCDILINTTSVGMWPHMKETPLPQLSRLLQPTSYKLPRPLVFDIIYRPRMTKLLRDAKGAGCKIITGDKMFLAQAKKSFRLWTGRKMPLRPE